jgi:hypothetical protein
MSIVNIATSYKLQATSYKLQATSYKLLILSVSFDFVKPLSLQCQQTLAFPLAIFILFSGDNIMKKLFLPGLFVFLPCCLSVQRGMPYALVAGNADYEFINNKLVNTGKSINRRISE